MTKAVMAVPASNAELPSNHSPKLENGSEPDNIDIFPMDLWILFRKPSIRSESRDGTGQNYVRRAIFSSSRFICAQKVAVDVLLWDNCGAVANNWEDDLHVSLYFVTTCLV